ncbi:AMP-binding protein, partial [Gordonia paraffinivorans]|uniref:AMP-binding protein n=1 Tax=Gordonia paraffinivorans TaxID=175628 RepID=UPI001444E9A1
MSEPETVVGDIDLLDAVEHASIVSWSGAEASREPGFVTGTLADLVENVEPSFLHAIAVVDGERTIDYGELTDRTNVLARELIRLGVGPEVAVAISVPRSLEMVIAAHA